jgi:hypothetical protein
VIDVHLMHQEEWIRQSRYFGKYCLGGFSISRDRSAIWMTKESSRLEVRKRICSAVCLYLVSQQSLFWPRGDFAVRANLYTTLTGRQLNGLRLAGKENGF